MRVLSLNFHASLDGIRLVGNIRLDDFVVENCFKCKL